MREFTWFVKGVHATENQFFVDISSDKIALKCFEINFKAINFDKRLLRTFKTGITDDGLIISVMKTF